MEEAKHLSDYIIWIRFKDGTQGEIDLREDLEGSVFEPLKDLDYFKKFNEFFYKSSSGIKSRMGIKAY